jgi:hypothetical protein
VSGADLGRWEFQFTQPRGPPKKEPSLLTRAFSEPDASMDPRMLLANGASSSNRGENEVRLFGIGLCMALLATMFLPGARADDWNRKTV